MTDPERAAVLLIRRREAFVARRDLNRAIKARRKSSDLRRKMEVANARLLQAEAWT